MFFNLKIVATDFQFNREVLGNACLYYEPMNAVDAASKLAKLIKDKRLQSELSKKMKARMSLFDNYDNHFNSILQFLIDVASKKY